jgi:hypothetical protein
MQLRNGSAITHPLLAFRGSTVVLVFLAQITDCAGVHLPLHQRAVVVLCCTCGPCLQALKEAESDVQLLLSAVFAAARDQTLGADGILMISREGSSLTGSVASMISRLRGMQDGLSSLRR